MSRASVLARGRRVAEASMIDACVIRRVAGQVTNKETGEVTPLILETYSGKCRVQQTQTQAQQEDIGEDNLLLLRLEVQLPVMTSVGLQAGDRITITASVNDPDLVNRLFVIHDLAHATEKTARRVQCVERTAS